MSRHESSDRIFDLENLGGLEQSFAALGPDRQPRSPTPSVGSRPVARSPGGQQTNNPSPASGYVRIEDLQMLLQQMNQTTAMPRTAQPAPDTQQRHDSESPSHGQNENTGHSSPLTISSGQRDVVQELHKTTEFLMRRPFKFSEKFVDLLINSYEIVSIDTIFSILPHVHMISVIDDIEENADTVGDTITEYKGHLVTLMVFSDFLLHKKTDMNQPYDRFNFDPISFGFYRDKEYFNLYHRLNDILMRLENLHSGCNVQHSSQESTSSSRQAMHSGGIYHRTFVTNTTGLSTMQVVLEAQMQDALEAHMQDALEGLVDSIDRPTSTRVCQRQDTTIKKFKHSHYSHPHHRT